MLKFRAMLYAENEQKFVEKVEAFVNDEVIASYPNFKSHILTFYMRGVDK